MKHDHDDLAEKQQPIRQRRRKDNEQEKNNFKTEVHPTSRYPKRGSRKCYKEQEVPDEDHFLYCEECEDFYFGDCPIHGPLFPLADKDCSDTAENKSLASLPDGLEVKESRIPNAGLGVFAVKFFPFGTRFGPYEGKKVRPDIPKDDMDTSYMWEIMREGRVVYYVNGKDEKYGNWLRFINCSRNESEQNLVAFQYHGQIYYRAYKEIAVGDELLVWYGDEYARDLGIVPDVDDKPCTETTTKPDIGPIYTCNFCMVSFCEEKYLTKHLRFCRKLPFEYNPRIYLQNEYNEEGQKMAKTPDFPTYMPSNTKKNRKINNVSKKAFISPAKSEKSRTYTGEKTFKCDICGKGFNRLVTLQKHLRTHTGVKPYKCDFCGKGFGDSSNLQKHLRTHTGEKPYKCNICGKGFNQSNHLQKHLRTHTGEKPYKCDICGKGFSQLVTLQTHLRTHTGEKPYKCDVCTKGFKMPHHLQTHLRTHTGEKPYKCDICKKGCNQLVNLQTHLRTHTGEKPYKCDICGRGFSHLNRLKGHLRTHT